MNTAALPRSGGLLLCLGCSASGRCRLGITSFSGNGPNRFVADLACGAENISGPGIAHGGWVAGVLDEVVGLSCVEVLGRLAVTARLEIVYRRPTPADQPLRIEAEVEVGSDQRARGSGSLLLVSDDSVLATVRGEWVARPAGRPR